MRTRRNRLGRAPATRVVNGMRDRPFDLLDAIGAILRWGFAASIVFVGFVVTVGLVYAIARR